MHRQRAQRLADRTPSVTLFRVLSAMSRRLLKFTGGSVDDYATLSTPTLSPSC